jgi:hypothetical protein
VKLSVREIILAKNALLSLESIGPAGLSEAALIEQTALRSEVGLLTSIEAKALMRCLVEKRWIERFTEPLTGSERWYLSEDGRLAAHAL